ncbi:hypothetical protein EV197_1301 [Aquimarina brevivitae]|uniref:Uncharacterized protein n=2 Tax=Aquimarina brevivitae TaxID=323412 RepID=A0A4V2F7J8_9FLAO|nr:hypothetical protein EV197_1301 [Aquimarina brevivitae]
MIGASVLGMLSLTAFTTMQISPNVTAVQEDDVTAIINKDTTEKELEDLTAFFAENGIDLIIENVAYNDAGEITSLSLILQRGKAKSHYSSSSNVPISEVELGYKKGNLFITNTGMFDILAWKNQAGFSKAPIDMDSLLKKHSFAFDFDFDKDIDSIFLGNGVNVQQLKDQIMNSFKFEQDENGNFVFKGQNLGNSWGQGSKKYQFVDNPEIDKLIIIDGKESDFITLDKMAKAERLDVVDFLNPATAISIYGDKAKDGAIIATTKQ